MTLSDTDIVTGYQQDSTATSKIVTLTNTDIVHVVCSV